jgi:hypothetical protein
VTLYPNAEASIYSRSGTVSGCLLWPTPSCRRTADARSSARNYWMNQIGLSTRFVAFTVPMPVVKSQPTLGVKAGW